MISKSKSQDGLRLHFLIKIKMNKPKDIVKGLTVVVGDMPINTALRKFKQKVDDSGLLETIRERMFYEKPTTERKRKKGAARSRWLKRLRDNELPKKLY